jgi:type I restriction enzyme M protein
VNMYLHQFASPLIHEYDTLSSEDRWNEYYNVILANPPFFSPTGGIQPHSRFGVQSKRAEVLFVDYIIEHLKSTGRAGIVVPEGVIFQTGNAYKTLRKKLVEDCLVGVISLPAGVFQPYSGVKTSILILDKQLNQKSESIFFAKVENDGFSLGTQRTAIRNNDLPEVLHEFADFFRNPALQKKSSRVYTKTKQEILEKTATSLNFTLEKNLERTSEFELRKLQDLVEIRGGGTPSRKNDAYWDAGTIKWITCKHLDNEGHVQSHEKISELGLSESSSNLVPKDSTIVVTRVSVGKVSWADEEYAVNQDLTGLTVRNEAELNPKYLFFVMRSLGDHIKESAQGIGVTGVTREFIKQLEIPLPPIEVQQRIVDDLEGYQTEIKVKNEEIVGLREKIQDRISKVWGE